MKHIYTSVIAFALCLISVNLSAQSDTILSRQVMLEKDYAPTIQKASRINQTPSVYEHQIQIGKASFINQSPSLVIPAKLGKVAPGEISTAIPYSTKRGYAQLAAGTNMNIDLAAGWRVLDTKKDKLNILGTYTSTNGNVDYAEKGFTYKKKKAKHSDLNLNVRYQHAFDPATLSVFGSFLNAGYNYYGNNLYKPLDPNYVDPFDYSNQQRTNIFKLGTGLKSNERIGNMIHYDADIAYSYFKNKYGLIPEHKGMKGGIIELNADVNAEISADGYLGVRFSLINQSFSGKPAGLSDTLKTFTNIGLSPYFSFEGLNWDVEFGFNTNILFDKKNKFFVSPNIQAQYHLDEANTLYASITGGVNNNTFIDILSDNRYASPLGRIKYSKTQYDIEAGFKTGVFPGLQLELFAGYKNTKDEHFYVASPIYGYDQWRWANVSIPAYADLSTGKFGVMAKTNLIPLTTLSARATAYFYSVKKMAYSIEQNNDMPKAKAWGKPNFSLELAAVIKPFEPMTISANYLLSTGRKAFALTKKQSLKDINELNAKLDYQLTDWFTVNVRANNLLNLKYDYVHGYTLQGINVMGGVSFKF